MRLPVSLDQLTKRILLLQKELEKNLLSEEHKKQIELEIKEIRAFMKRIEKYEGTDEKL